MSETQEHDPVNHPKHYTGAHSEGMECIELVEYMTFCGGNAVKYLWRSGLKGSKVEDLQKARWYVERAEAFVAFYEGDDFRNQFDLHKKACAGFPTLVASAMMHVIREDYDLALKAIDALIAEASA